MRRKDREITDFAAMTDIVQACRCCRLGLTDTDGTAYIVPLNFGFTVEDKTLTLWFHGAAEGKKFDLLRQTSVVTFEMDTDHQLIPGAQAADYSFAYRSVMGRGTVEFAAGEEQRLQGLRCIMEHYTHRSDWPVPPAMVRATAVFCLRVTGWTAKAHRAL